LPKLSYFIIHSLGCLVLSFFGKKSIAKPIL
jgi:hypothetical protein